MADFYGKLIISSKDERHQEFVLSKGNVTLGRSTVSDIVLDDDSVSRNHARLDLEKSVFVLHDLGSANGSFVNGVKVKNRALSREIRSKSGQRWIARRSPAAIPRFRRAVRY